MNYSYNYNSVKKLCFNNIDLILFLYLFLLEAIFLDLNSRINYKIGSIYKIEKLNKGFRILMFNNNDIPMG